MSWRIFWTTMMKRAATDAPARVVFTNLEQRLLDLLVKDGYFVNPKERDTLAAYIGLPGGPPNLGIKRAGGYRYIHQPSSNDLATQLHLTERSAVGA